MELVVSLWLLRCMILRLRAKRASGRWRLAFAFATVFGLIAGCAVALRGEVRVSASTRLVSLPVPLAVYRKEGDHWTDFVTPPYVMYPGIAANALAITALTASPVWLAFLVANRGGAGTKP